jgi:hypothetical protein
MKIHNYSVRRLLLIVPVICSIAFSANSGVAGTAHRNVRVNFQKAVTGMPQTGHYLTIGQITYNSEDHGFDLPWPFGSESTQQ